MKARSAVATLFVTAVGVACGSFGSETASPAADGGAQTDATDETPGDAAVDAPPCDPAKTATDSHHCGACGHDCLGGDCVGGACRPVLLGSSPNDAPIFDVELLADSVVWATSDEPSAGGANHGLYFCPKEGCPPAPKNLAGDDTHRPTAIATNGVDLSYVAWATDQGVHGVYLVNGSGSSMRVADGSFEHGLRAFDDALFFVAYNTHAAWSRTLVRVDKASTAPFVQEVCTSYTPESGAVVNVNAFAYAPSFVYFGATNTSHIASCNLASGDVVTYTTTSDITLSMTATSAAVIWTGADDGRIHHCGVGATCAQETQEGDLGGFVHEVQYTGKELLFATSAGELHACDPATCGTTNRVVATAPYVGSSSPAYGHAITEDDRAYYFAAADLPDGGSPVSWRLYRLAK